MAQWTVHLASGFSTATDRAVHAPGAGHAAQRDPGVASLSLRALARGAGVSHAAPVHHFGDKRGLLTALAAEGHGLLAQHLRSALAEDGDLLAMGVAYVRFADAHPTHFDVMFRTELQHRHNPELAAARAVSFALLQSTAGADTSAGRGGDPTSASLAAWSLMHGLATLHLTGNLPPGRSIEDLARAAGRQLFPAP